jgi:hypothetical protein
VVQIVGARRAIIVLAVACNCAFAQESPERYLYAQNPGRRALVIGNANYTKAEMLPGSATDAVRMAATLKALGFKVTLAQDVSTRSDFVTDYFAPFVRTIEPGDLVVVYFSGHGFSHGADNYLLPIDFPELKPDTDVFTSYISSTGLYNKIDERNPSFQLVVLDACRDFKKVKDRPGDADELMKGFTEARNVSQNVVVAYSANVGQRSIGSAKGEMSVYTKALVKQLPEKGRSFHLVLATVRADVKNSTQERQIPWSSDSSSADLYFNPTPKVYEQQLDSWKAALTQGAKNPVKSFIVLYGWGPYGFAARQWLRDNPDAPEDRGSAASPESVELAWARGRTEVAIYDSSVVPLRNSLAWGAEPRPGAQDSNLGAFRYGLAGALAGLGEVVTTRAVHPNVRPNAVSAYRPTIKAGKRLVIEGIESDYNKNLWLKAKSGEGAAAFYIPVADTPAGSSFVGKPTREVVLAKRDHDIAGVIDPQPMLTAVKALQDSGKEITWVSISAPKASTPAARAAQQLRILNLRSRLEAAGVHRTHITALESESVPTDTVRLRVFTK